VSVAGLLLASCLVGPGYCTPKAKVLAQWSAGQSSQLADAYWWHGFNDPVLSDLIEIA
jgi:outer membrane protein TolC